MAPPATALQKDKDNRRKYNLVLIFCPSEVGGDQGKTGYQRHTAKNEHWENEHHLRPRANVESKVASNTFK